MATKMVMPLLGQTMEEGTIIKWFKKEGDAVKAGEPLLEVMTDKVNMEVEAPEGGTLRKILAQPDDIVPVKDPICIIGAADENIDALLGEAAPVGEREAPAEPAHPEVRPPVAAAPAAQQTVVSAAAPEGRIFASPAAKRVARERGIDIAVLAGRGSGPNGRIVEKDVLDFAAAGPKATPLAGRMAADMGVAVAGVAGTGVGGKVTSEDITRAAAPAPSVPAAPLAIGATIPYQGMRKAVGENVARSLQTSPHVTLVTEVDMTECIALRSQILEDIEKNYGVRISYTDIIAKAVARAILDKPIVNSSLQGDQIVIHDRVNIGIATAIEGGLVVPVVKDVPSKTIPQISKEIKELSARARAGQGGGEDFKGGTFTISNLGIYGIQSFNPIITPGQSAILGVCAIVQKPVVIDEDIEIRSMMNLCLSFDHRVMDGAPAAEYLARLKEILESPYLIFM
ncbi:MAG: 2-oxo acid dehydrogenase subunit E2 [Armatimonadetes bacterium]|nr:2-oxo acid dehydrogenase subunit E2 [Armatimonadota bacterium]